MLCSVLQCTPREHNCPGEVIRTKRSSRDNTCSMERIMADKLKCLRCGQCCTYIIEGVKKTCKYLRGTPGKGHKTICRIYKSESRIGVQIDKGKYCGKRNQSTINQPGCPYNIGELIEAERLYGDLKTEDNVR